MAKISQQDNQDVDAEWLKRKEENDRWEKKRRDEEEITKYG